MENRVNKTSQKNIPFAGWVPLHVLMTSLNMALRTPSENKSWTCPLNREERENYPKQQTCCCVRASAFSNDLFKRGPVNTSWTCRCVCVQPKRIKSAPPTALTTSRTEALQVQWCCVSSLETFTHPFLHRAWQKPHGPERATFAYATCEALWPEVPLERIRYWAFRSLPHPYCKRRKGNTNVSEMDTFWKLVDSYNWTVYESRYVFAYGRKQNLTAGCQVNLMLNLMRG